jgi:hypothetical protein
VALPFGCNGFTFKAAELLFYGMRKPVSSLMNLYQVHMPPFLFSYQKVDSVLPTLVPMEAFVTTSKGSMIVMLLKEL